MSRTYRRKGKAPKWVTYEWEYVWRELSDGYQWREMLRVPIKGKALAKAISHYHTDNMWMQYPPDPIFRRLYGHKHDRQETRRNIHKELHSIEYGNVVFNKTINIDWIWW